MRKLRVSERDLMFALTGKAEGTSNYLDTRTGDVVPVFTFNRGKVLEMVRAEPDRYVRIAPQPGAEGFRIMSDFMKTVSRAEVRDALTAAMAGEHPFSRFRAALRSHPEESKRFHQFRALNTLRELSARLAAQGIELELVEDPD